MANSILIDNARERPSRAQWFDNPVTVIRADRADEVTAALEEMELARTGGAYLAGFFSYELGYVLEPRLAHLLPDERDAPLIWFGVYDAPIQLGPDEIQGHLSGASQDQCSLSHPELTMDGTGYRERFNAAQDYISAGDIYQLNLTLKGKFSFSGSARALYRELRYKQPVSHGCLIEADEFEIVSASPELFLEIRDGKILTRPMKGTAGRGLTLDQDRSIADWLSRDEKSRAENLMIVDLMRNDLGRVAETGSVRVNDLYTVETYETLHQMTSGVEGRLQATPSISELAHALFPPGSVTGAPKVRAMEIIAELETEARGVYTGAIGWFGPTGEAEFNVAIRTVTLYPDGKGEVGIGSGLVHDSKAGSEYDECALKMRFLTDPVREFQLIETLLHEPGKGYALLERHLDRLAQSAEYFRYPYKRDAALEALSRHAEALEHADHRVRMLLHRDGEINVTSVELPGGPPPAEMTFVLSRHRMASSNPFLYHKTTERQLYDTDWTEMHEETGSDEVVYLNERGELTEGSRTNIFIKRGNSMVTPALSCGLLPGTFRQELLETGQASEAVLRLDDLEGGDEIFLGNSVRGLLPARQLVVDTIKAAAS